MKRYLLTAMMWLGACAQPVERRGPLKGLADELLPRASSQNCVEVDGPPSYELLLQCVGSRGDTQVVVTTSKRTRSVTRVLRQWRAVDIARAANEVQGRVSAALGATPAACDDPELTIGRKWAATGYQVLLLGSAADSSLQLVHFLGGASPAIACREAVK